MSKTNEKRSAQGDRSKQGYDLQVVPEDEKRPGQSDQDLGKRWGAGSQTGPRTTRKGTAPPPQTFPGGLISAPVEPGSPGFDLPVDGSDQLEEPRLDLTSKEGSDRREGLDLTSKEGSDRRVGLDLTSKEGSDRHLSNLGQPPQGGSDRRNSEPFPKKGESGNAVERPDPDVVEPPEDSEAEEEEPFEEPEDPDDQEEVLSSASRQEWRKVPRRKGSRGERSDGSEDVENLLDGSGSDNGNIYFPSSFNENGDAEGDEPEPAQLSEVEKVANDPEPDNVPLIDLNKVASKSKKDRKGKKPIQAPGFDKFMSSVGAGSSRSRKSVKEAPKPTPVKPDKKNIPAGVHFSEPDKVKKKSIKTSKDGQPKGDATGDKTPVGDGGSKETTGAKNTSKETAGVKDIAGAGSKSQNPEGGSGPPPPSGGAKTPKTPKAKPTPSRKRSSSSSSSDSSSSDSSSSDSSSSDSSSSDSSSSDSSSSDSSSSDSLSSDSSSSSSSPDTPGKGTKKSEKSKEARKRSKKRRREKEEKMRKRVKVDSPGVYNGKDDLDAFDKWAVDVKTWKSVNRLSDRFALRIMGKYLSGKAYTFYKKFVYRDLKQWTLKTVFEGLFDYCFPRNFIQELRKQLMTATQGKARVTDFARDIELMADRFPDVNARGKTEILWNGLQQQIRTRAVELGVHPERSSHEKIIKYATRAEDAIVEAANQLKASREGRTWGRFANRVDGPRPYRPSGDDSRTKRHGSDGMDRVRANAVTPQPRAESSRQGERRSQGPRQGKKVSRARMDQLRSEGKCFQCEQPGHMQKDCPKLSSMRPPHLRTNNINIARLERLSNEKEKADLQVGRLSLFTSEGFEDDTTPAMRRAYELCASTWGDDDRWSDPETRHEGRYRISQFDVGHGELVEIIDGERPGSHVLEVDVERFSNPEFSLTDMFATNANTERSSVREGGFRDQRNYRIWGWTALTWLRTLVKDQLEFENSTDEVVVQPSMKGYCLHLEGTEANYEITHAEVLGDNLHIRRVLDVMRTTCSESQNTALNWRQSLMLQATRLMAGAVRQRKRTSEPEGASSIEKTSMRVKDQSRKVPEPVIVIAKINGQEVRALVDTGSMADFISTTVAEQLGVKKETYSKPLSVQLAVHGSRSKINCGTKVRFQYQSIDSERRFDIANLDNYDVILGTPFLYQHKVAVGLNPPCVVVGSKDPVQMSGPDVITISSAAADLLDNGIEKLRKQLRDEAEDLCPDTSKTALPPMRAVNHTIPLIEPAKIYHFRPSRCPEAFREQWRAKKNAYLETGRWRTATGHNAIPLLMIPKISTTGGEPGLRTVFDKREQNANTHKLASPLPDIEEILREVSKHKHRSLIDGKDAYEQIRVIPDHVSRTIFTTPDGTMESLVMQQGDCNAGATYQTLMNHIFAPYLGVFMYVYLDDIIIFSDSIKEHVEHVRIIFDILRRERLFLGPNKMQFFAEELKILGHVIDAKGIRMDPHKVDKVLNWKTPPNKALLRSFIGAVGFLAPDCKGIRIPMGTLSGLTAESKPWRWDATAQRAFDDVKEIVSTHRDNHRKALDYSKNAEPIYVTTDGCLTGGGGYVSQGKDPKTASVVSFWSGKWNSAQQNYPVHEQELLSLVETLKRFRGILHGTRFTVRTDHRALIHFMRQRNLSSRQHRWIDILSEFDFEIEYIPGDTNGFADALSRIYSDETPGIARASSEFVDDKDELKTYQSVRVQPVYVETYLLSLMNAETRRSSRIAGKPVRNYKETKDRKPKGVAGSDATAVSAGGERTDEPAMKQKGDGQEARPTPHRPENHLLEVSSDLGVSFPECLKDRYPEDPFFKPIIDNPSEFTNFRVRDGFVFFTSEDVETLAIPDVKTDGQGVRELLIRQGHTILAHLGAEKTATYLRDQVWWKSMVGDIERYCKSCHTCAVSKPLSGKPHGKLKTMPVPTRPWQYIGIDFVGPMPESVNRTGPFDMICVIIDILTSMVHLVPSKQNYRASDIAELLFDSVYRLHGLAERIISDRDSLFTSKFWKRLHKLLGTELRMSSAYHPQTDGATERANRTMTQMIRQCVRPDQKDWVMKLPAVEFAINSARSSTTGFSPFQLNYGKNPNSMIWTAEDEFPGVQKFAERMKLAIMQAHDAIIASRIENTVQANRKRVTATYQEGDLVYLSTRNISLPKGLARKLAPKYLGPFKISKVLKEGATYHLDLSEELVKRGLHPAFHASLLKPHVPNDDRRFPGRLPSQFPGFGKRPDEWIVESILDHQGKGVNSEFEIQWKAGDRTWAPYREVMHLMAMERYCDLVGVGDPSELPAKRGGNKGEEPTAIICSLRLLQGYKDGVEEGEFATASPMADSFSHGTFATCATYAQHVREHHLGLRDAPAGPPPPGYNDYIVMTSGQDHTMNPYLGHSSYQPVAQTHNPYATATNNANNISMPPEVFNHLVDSQVRTMELATGARPAPRYDYYQDWSPPAEHVDRYGRDFGRGRGAYRGGRDDEHGGHMGRSNHNDRSGRNSNRDSNRNANRGSNRNANREENRNNGRADRNDRRSSRNDVQGVGGGGAQRGLGNNRRPTGSRSRAPGPTAMPPHSVATAVAGPSLFREVETPSEAETVSEAATNSGESERSFLARRRVPADEVESALGWRMDELKVKAVERAVAGDDGVLVEAEEDETMADEDGSDNGEGTSGQGDKSGVVNVVGDVDDAQK
jgi:hypothetical protein